MHINCRFLEVDAVNSEEDAVRWSINAAVQRGNIYCSESGREQFREEWKKELRMESQRYRGLASALSDSEHCRIIGGIADRLSSRFAPLLNGRRLRFGTSQACHSQPCEAEVQQSTVVVDSLFQELQVYRPQIINTAQSGGAFENGD